MAGVCGVLACYSISGAIQSALGFGSHWAILCIDDSGSFALGLCLSLLAIRVPPTWQEPMQLAIAMGFLGAFTIFSTLEADAASLLQTNGWPAMALYLIGSVALGLVAFWGGMRVG